MSGDETRWRYHTADGAMDFSSVLPRRERPSSRIQSFNTSSRPVNPLRPATTSPRYVSSNDYLNSMRHASSVHPNNRVSRPNMHTSMPQGSSRANMQTGIPQGMSRPHMQTGMPQGSSKPHMHTGMPQGISRPNMHTGMPQGRGYGYDSGRRFTGRPLPTNNDWQNRINNYAGHGHPQRRPNANRYYAYNTNLPPNKHNDTKRWPSSKSDLDSASTEFPSSLTTPELVISTMVPVPNELPLSLAIMVGEDNGVDASSWKSNTKQVGSLESAEDIESLGVICTSVTTIAATAVTLSLAHVIGLVGAYCCYKWHRKSKRKKILQKSLQVPITVPPARRSSGSGRQEDVFYAKPEVSFRNVYGSYRPPP